MQKWSTNYSYSGYGYLVGRALELGHHTRTPIHILSVHISLHMPKRDTSVEYKLNQQW